MYGDATRPDRQVVRAARVSQTECLEARRLRIGQTGARRVWSNFVVTE